MKRLLDNPFTYFLVGPFPISFVIPLIVATLTNSYILGGFLIYRWCGAVLVIIGFIPLISSFIRFQSDGDRSPHPFNEAPKLVMTGFYSFVRNPMYVGVMCVIFGVALYSSNYWVIIYQIPVFLFVNAFIARYEEPTLSKEFGSQYAEYCKHVRRWIPRLSRYEPE
jgi:protein-S-isoprenylcysteine O-methyltransferase Ste14